MESLPASAPPAQRLEERTLLFPRARGFSGRSLLPCNLSIKSSLFTVACLVTLVGAMTLFASGMGQLFCPYGEEAIICLKTLNTAALAGAITTSIGALAALILYCVH